ncbi:MAG TPA: DUF3617 domain-containing protein [Usitatibacter sp.]|nr:DUF3617 domain-containing protein [Usitatibacter sp.]
MKIATLLALGCTAAFALAASAADNPFSAFKGKMKAGLYEYHMDVDMGAVPGMPPGMGRQSHSFQHCVTDEDIHKGEVNKDQRSAPRDCEVKDFHMSGNTATYKMVCNGQHPMSSENRITFMGSGYDMDMKMSLNEGGHPMNMTQHMQARYLGACSK